MDYLEYLKLETSRLKKKIMTHIDNVNAFKVVLHLNMKQLDLNHWTYFSTKTSLGKVEPKCLKEFTE